jgi:hypothetical protein
MRSEFTGDSGRGPAAWVDTAQVEGNSIIINARDAA